MGLGTRLGRTGIQAKGGQVGAIISGEDDKPGFDIGFSMTAHQQDILRLDIHYGGISDRQDHFTDLLVDQQEAKPWIFARRI